jgi:phenylacetate-CoA ligase
MKLRPLLQNYLKPAIHRQYKELMAFEKYARSEMFTLQEQRLQTLIRYAYQNTRYYHELFDAVGLGEKILKGTVNWKDIPIINKRDLQNSASDMVSSVVKPSAVFMNYTGGSTGEPVRIYYDMNTLEFMFASARRYYQWCGWRQGEKILNFWGAKQDLRVQATFRRRVSEYIWNERTLNAYQFDIAILRYWESQLIEYSPVILQGYPSVMSQFAKYVKEHGKKMPRLKGIYSTAETLLPWQRTLMEEVFQCKVYNQYGSREIVSVACECSAGSMHWFPDMVQVEVNNPGEDGTGALILTSLTNRAMPFVRYEIGDIGAIKAGNCVCGSEFPMLEMGICRMNDLITTSDGRLVYPGFFNRLLDGMVTKGRYQFRQVTRDRIELYVEREGATGVEQRLEGLAKRIKQELDPQMNLVVRIVDQIQTTKSGKHRFVVSELDRSNT